MLPRNNVRSVALVFKEDTYIWATDLKIYHREEPFQDASTDELTEQTEQTEQTEPTKPTEPNDYEPNQMAMTKATSELIVLFVIISLASFY